jgi:hypothetical protein
MTRTRLLVSCSLTASVLALLLLAPGGGQAAQDDGEDDGDWRLLVACKTEQDTNRDFVKLRAATHHRVNGVWVPASGRPIRSTMTDLVPENGNNVVDRKDRDQTNANGVAILRHEFNNFGNYRIELVVKKKRRTVARKKIHFGVADRKSGKCDKPIPGGQ